MVICVEGREIEITYKELLNGVSVDKLMSTHYYKLILHNPNKQSLGDREITILEVFKDAYLDNVFVDYDNTVITQKSPIADFLILMIMWGHRIINLEVLRDILDSDMKVIQW